MKSYDNIEDMLKDTGLSVKVFRSGAGLRVARSFDPDTEYQTAHEDYYGESYSLSEALRVLSDDIKAGHRQYQDVYGSIEEHCLTGVSVGESKADEWVAGGRRIMFSAQENEIVVVAESNIRCNTPEEICERAYKGEHDIYWRFKDEPKKVYCSGPCSGLVLMGTQGCSTNGIEGKGIGNFDRDVRYEGRGKTLQEAIDNLPTLHTEMTPDWEYVSDKEAQYILAKIKFAL